MIADYDRVLYGSNVFISNTAPTGSAVHMIKSTLKSYGSILFANNSATLYSTAYFVDSNGSFDGLTLMSQNSGSFFAFNSKISFSGCTFFIDCSLPKKSLATVLDEGGALTLIQTTLSVHGETIFEHSQAEFSGAILATESQVNLNDKVTMTDNKASKNGGALYLFHSDVHSLQGSTVTISNNNATEKGGAIHAVSSSITCSVAASRSANQYETIRITGFEEYEGSLMYIVENTAQYGGAIYLKFNSKITLLKD